MVAAPSLRTFIADADCGFRLAGVRDPPLVSWRAWRFRSVSWILVFASSTICCVDNLEKVDKRTLEYLDDKAL